MKPNTDSRTTPSPADEVGPSAKVRVQPSEVVRIPELDGLRGIAVALVMFHHYCQNVPANGALDRVFFGFANSAWIGVDIFFVLSGLLITGVLLDAKDADNYFRIFYLRRALRIFPTYYLLLLLLFVVGPTVGISLHRRTSEDWAWFGLYGSNFLTAWHGWPDRPLAHLWSLAIEEHFYFIWPVLVFALSLPTFLVVGTAVSIVCIAMRAWGLDHGWNPTAVYVLTQSRVDALAIGGCLATLIRLPTMQQRWLGNGGAMMSLVVAATSVHWLGGPYGLDWTRWNAIQLIWGFSWLAIGIASCLAFALSTSPQHALRRFLRWSPLRTLGRLSYALYLFHLPIEALARHWNLHPVVHVNQDCPNWPYTVVYIAGNACAALLIAKLSWIAIESPLLHLKNRWRYQ